MVRIALYRQTKDEEPIAVAIQDAAGAETTKARHFIARELAPRLKSGYYVQVEESEQGTRWKVLTRIEGTA